MANVYEIQFQFYYFIFLMNLNYIEFTICSQMEQIMQLRHKLKSY